MKSKYDTPFILLLIAAGVFFALMPYFHQSLLGFFKITQTHYVDLFFDFITMAAALMISNLLIAYFVKPKWTGFVFLAWSMLKLMLVMGFFLFYLFPENIILSNPEIYELVIIYMIYLTGEVIFTYFLIRFSDKISGN